MFDNLWANARQVQQQEFEKDAAQDARKWDRQEWTHRSTHQYQNTMKDLEAAGLNPMMVFGGGASVGSSGGTSAKASSGIASASSSLGQNIASAVGLRLQKKMNDAQIVAQKAAANASTAQAALSNQKAETEKYNRDLADTLNMKTTDSMPNIMKWLSVASDKGTKMTAPTSGKKGKWLRAGGKLFNLSNPAQRILFLKELDPKDAIMWRKAFNKKYGDKL